LVASAAVALAHASRVEEIAPPQPFVLPEFPPGVIPDHLPTIAQDEGIAAASQWAGQAYSGLNLVDGVMWPGFAMLAELAQRPEYRKIAKTVAEEATRKWIKIQATGETDKSAKVKELEGEFKRLRVREHFRKAAEFEAYMGRHHLFLDFGAQGDVDELSSSVGCGVDQTSCNKVGRGSLKGMRTVEAIWCYPSGYNTTNPLSEDWYAPKVWYVQGRAVHTTRLLTFVSHEVPDLLKPTYSFGGVSISQQAKPYIDNWLRTRQGVSDLIDSFSDKGLKLDLVGALASGSLAQVIARVDAFVKLRNNRGVMVLDKGSGTDKGEEFFNIETSLGTLDALQAQAQEQMSSVSGIPLVKLLGITPKGLNASSDGEIRVFYDSIHAYQDAVFSPNLNRVFAFAQINLWGEVDPDLSYSYNPLWSMDAKDLADIERTKAETGKALIEARVISREEERTRVAHAEDSAYAGLDTSKVPPPSISDATDLAVKKATVILQAGEGGTVPEAEVLRGLRDTGLFPGLTDADIDAAASRVADAPEVGEADVDSLASDAEWKEGDHPRSENGQFGSGSTAHVVASHNPETGNIVVHGVHSGRTEATKHQIAVLQKQHDKLDRDYDLASYGENASYQGAVHTQKMLAAFNQPQAHAKSIAVAGKGDGTGGLHIVAEGHHGGGLTIHGAYHDPDEAGRHADRLSQEAWADKGEIRSEITDREARAARREFNKDKPAAEHVSQEQVDDQSHEAFEAYLNAKHPMDETLPHPGRAKSNRYLVDNDLSTGSGEAGSRTGVICVLHHKAAGA
jgi:hypothetical protein